MLISWIRIFVNGVAFCGSSFFTNFLSEVEQSQDLRFIVKLPSPVILKNFLFRLMEAGNVTSLDGSIVEIDFSDYLVQNLLQ